MKKSAAALLLICFFAFTGCAGNAPDVPALEQPTEAVESAAPAAQETAIPEPAAPEPAAPEPAPPDPTAPADAAAPAEPAESASAEVQLLAAAVPQIPMSAGTAGDFVTFGGVCETVADIAREGTAWKFSGRSSTWVASLDVTDYVASGGLYEFTAWAYVDKADATVMHLSLETKGAGGTVAYATFGDYNGEPRQGGVWVPLGGRIRFDANSGNTYTIYLETGHYQQGNKFYGHMPDIWVDDISFMKIENEYDLTLPSLAGVYADKFLMGNILAPAEIGDAVTTEMFKHHYNTVTANNHMKPAHLTSAKGVYDFTQADRLVDWAVENGIAVHGHVLVWHQQSAEWLNGGATAPLTRAEAKENLEAYINEVAKHFTGRVVSWDVVNEAIADSAAPGMAWRNALRKDGGIGEVGGSGGSPWWAAYENGANKDAGESGADYVYDAFVFARLADPDAVLYYNDYNETVAGKRAAIVEMTNELNAQWAADGRNTEPGRLLIEGLGMQGHYFTGHAQDNAVEVEKTIRAFAATGAEVSITELDLPIGRYRGIPANITDELRQQQARIYSEIFDVLSSNSDVITRVTFWGKNDDNSWDGRGAGEPLLFDVNYGKKPAFDAIVD